MEVALAGETLFGLSTEMIDAKRATLTAIPIVRFISFPLDSSGWFAGDIENYPIYACNLIGDAIGNFRE